jgi:surface protein
LIFKTLGNAPAITQDNIKSAINLWVADATIAEATFGHIKDWDVSQVTDMSQLFRSRSSFNEDISSWDVSNVTNMSAMFEYASSFNQDITGWNISNVTNMNLMFNGVTDFNQPIGSWDVSNVTDMSYMFLYTSSFNQDISNWNVSKVTNMIGMFSYATNFNQDLSKWCVFNITIEPNGFSQNGVLEENNKPNWGNCNILKITTNEITELTKNSVQLGGNIESSLETVTERGIVYATYLTNTKLDVDEVGVNKVVIGDGIGTFNTTISNLEQGTEYFYRTYAVTTSGTSYGKVFVFKTLGVKLIIQENISAAVDLWIANPASAEEIYGHIKNWDVSNVTSMFGLFRNRTNFTDDISNWDVSNVTDMNLMFYGASAFNQDISNWNVSNVTSMGQMFYRASNFNQYIGNWDVSNVTNMSQMFFDATTFNQDLSGWCVSNFRFRPSSFSFNSALEESNQPVWGTCIIVRITNNGAKDITKNSATIGGDISATKETVTERGIVYVNKDLNTNPRIGETEVNKVVLGDGIGTFDTNITNLKQGTNYIYRAYAITASGVTYAQTLEFRTLGLKLITQANIQTAVNDWDNNPTAAEAIYGHIKDWDVSNVTDMKYLFRYKSHFNEDISSWNVSNVTDMNQMFFLATRFNQDIGDWNVANVTEMSDMFSRATNFNQNLNGWCVSNINSEPSSFSSFTSLEEANKPIWGTCPIMKLKTAAATSITDNAAIIGGNIISTEEPVTERGVIYVPKSTNTNPKIGEAGVNKVILGDGTGEFSTTITNLKQNTEYAYRAYAISTSGESYGKVLNFKTLKILTPITQENIKTAAAQWVSNPTIAEDIYGHIKDWNVSNVTNMSELFQDADSFNEDISNWDVSNVTDISRMFRGAFSFNQDISRWDVSKVKNMGGMFQWSSFNQDISNWDVSSVSNMMAMFRANFDFNQDISNWNVSNVTNMHSMFNLAHSFNQNIGNWDVSKVRRMGLMFAEAHSFNQDIGNWNVSSATDMSGMFSGFSEATNFNQDISSWDVSSVTNMANMFANASKFNQDISGWDVSKVTDMEGMFSNTPWFNQDLSQWCVSNIASEPNSFSSRSALSNSNKPVWGTCTSLSTDDFNIGENINIYLLNRNEIQISGITVGDKANIELFDMLGKKVDSYVIKQAETNNSILLKNRKTGLYIVRLKTSDTTKLKKIFIK